MMKKSASRIMLDEQIEIIEQALHYAFPERLLIKIRDIVIEKRRRSWKKKSFLGQALMHHHYLSRDETRMDFKHTLLAELLFNFAIGSKEEYYEMCRKYRIAPFRPNTSKFKTTDRNPMSAKEVIDILKEEHDESKKQIKKKIIREIDNADAQDYPIADFEELMKKTNLN
jgi:hypothetical protein